MGKVASILLLLLVAGCIKPAAPLVQTVTVLDTVVVPEVRIDTQLVAGPTDTITLYKDRLKVQIVRRLDTLRVSAECEVDTIYRTVSVQAPVQTVKVKDPTPWWAWPLAVAAFGVTVALWLKKLLEL